MSLRVTHERTTGTWTCDFCGEKREDEHMSRGYCGALPNNWKRMRLKHPTATGPDLEFDACPRCSAHKRNGETVKVPMSITSGGEQ